MSVKSLKAAAGQGKIYILAIMIKVFGAIEQLSNNIRLIPTSTTTEHFFCVMSFSLLSLCVTIK